MDYRSKLYPHFFNPLLIKSQRPRTKEVAIIGSGSIGPDIGYHIKSALPEIKLYLVDVVEEPLKNAKQRFASYAKKGVEKRKMTEERAEATLKNIVYTMDYNQIKNCDLVIEAATEEVNLKRKIFDLIEKIVSEDAIITSNTSSIPAERLFQKMKKPERTTVTHFFAPAWRNPGVEVVRWAGASLEVIDYLQWFFANTGKFPIATDNVVGFMLDRIFDNICNEAAYLLDKASANQIDAVAEEFVFAGPFYILNMASGNPVVLETVTYLSEEGDHCKPAPIFSSVASWVTGRPGSRPEVPVDRRNIVKDRLLGLIFSQSFDICDRGIGTKEDLNFSCQIALGFRKGPLDMMRDIGEAEVDRIIKKFVHERPGFPQPKNPLSFYQDFKRHLLIDEMDGVKIITIRRPQVMNALNDEIMDEILSVLKESSGDASVKGFVITGYGTNAFSAGADIGKFPEMLGDREASIGYAKACAKVQRFIDQMEKPVVAAVNGLALGGGLELAIRCHSIVATKNASLQFPEITLGILPAIGGCVVPYRKWPQAATVFHEMVRFGKPLKVQEAQNIGMVKKVTDDYFTMIKAAIEEVNNLQGKIPRIPDGKVAIAPIQPVETPIAGKLVLSREAVSIIEKTIIDGAAANTFQEALEIGYRGFGTIACTEAAKEGISAFQERRPPNYKK